mmetsp:Transcript_14085/g.30584  ORF Transcript_14085/g.30584 Transcript_14085/m.30584 type:complete len:87 (-) Transcript_14085:405-665(-)
MLTRRLAYQMGRICVPSSFRFRHLDIGQDVGFLWCSFKCRLFKSSQSLFGSAVRQDEIDDLVGRQPGREPTNKEYNPGGATPGSCN